MYNSPPRGRGIHRYNNNTTQRLFLGLKFDWLELKFPDALFEAGEYSGITVNRKMQRPFLGLKFDW